MSGADDDSYDGDENADDHVDDDGEFALSMVEGLHLHPFTYYETLAGGGVGWVITFTTAARPARPQIPPGPAGASPALSEPGGGPRLAKGGIYHP